MRPVEVQKAAVEDRAQEPVLRRVDGRPAEHPVEGGDDDETLRQSGVSPARGLLEAPSEPAGLGRQAPHPVLEHNGGVVVGHHQRLAVHDVLGGPDVSVDEPHVPDLQAGGGTDADLAGQELLNPRVMVAADDVDHVEAFEELLEEVGYLGVLLLGGSRDRILDVADHD